MSDVLPSAAWWTPELREHLRQIAYQYHARVFGEQLARINFLPPHQRKVEYHAIRDQAQRYGLLNTRNWEKRNISDE